MGIEGGGSLTSRTAQLITRLNTDSSGRALAAAAGVGQLVDVYFATQPQVVRSAIFTGHLQAHEGTTDNNESYK